MGEAILRVTFPFQRACDVCHKHFRSLYRISLDGVAVYVCTGAEAVVARDRWMEKKRSGVSPYSKPTETDLMAEGDNIQDVTEDE